MTSLFTELEQHTIRVMNDKKQCVHCGAYGATKKVNYAVPGLGVIETAFICQNCYLELTPIEEYNPYE